MRLRAGNPRQRLAPAGLGDGGIEPFAREVDAARRVGGFHTAPVVDADLYDNPPCHENFTITQEANAAPRSVVIQVAGNARIGDDT